MFYKLYYIMIVLDIYAKHHNIHIIIFNVIFKEFSIGNYFDLHDHNLY